MKAVDSDEKVLEPAHQLFCYCMLRMVTHPKVLRQPFFEKKV